MLRPRGGLRLSGAGRPSPGRGGMTLHLCDVHLEWTRVHLVAASMAEARRPLAKALALVGETG